MSKLPLPKYSLSFRLSIEAARMLAEQTGLENRSKTSIVEDAIRDYCYKFRAEILREADYKKEKDNGNNR